MKNVYIHFEKTYTKSDGDMVAVAHVAYQPLEDFISHFTSEVGYKSQVKWIEKFYGTSSSCSLDEYLELKKQAFAEIMEVISFVKIFSFDEFGEAHEEIIPSEFVLKLEEECLK